MPKLGIFTKFWQLFVFLLIQQQHIYVCHIAKEVILDAEKTAYLNSTPTPTPLPQPLPILVVTASEATLLTVMRKLPKTTNDIEEHKNNKYVLDWEDLSSMKKNLTKKHRYRIKSIKTHCTREIFDIQVNINRPFRGLFYAKDFPLECRARGNNLMNISLRLPASGCGIRAETLKNGDLELTLGVMLQTEQKLRQSSDILRTLRCQLPAHAIAMNLDSPNISKHRTGRTYFKPTDSESSPSNKESEIEHIDELSSNVRSLLYPNVRPRVRIWLELGGPDGSGIVEVGQPTTLVVRAIVPGTMGVRIVDCSALDGLGESSQQLLDDAGCPIDHQVMPGLHERVRPVDEGWSKRNKDDPVEKIFSTTFAAFKFPDRERLHVSCGVQLCKGNCPNVTCQPKEKILLRGDQQLARIEVFNSLAVMAPQIEMNRANTNYGDDARASTNEQQTLRKNSTEGILCLSLSNLALSFCILGVIFFLAIIVAIGSLVVSRRQLRRQYEGQDSSAGMLTISDLRPHADMYTSSSSESVHSARLGSKLFMAYYSQRLPYGRVY